MDKFEGIKQSLEKELADDSKPWSKYLKLAEEKTGVQRSYLFFGKLNQTKLICRESENESVLKVANFLHDCKYLM